MKFLRYGPKGKEKPGMLDADGNIRDISKIVKDITPETITDLAAKVKKANIARLPKVAGKPRLGSCITGSQKFIAIGLNYSDHAAESNLPVPPEPVVFTKQMSCLSGPNDPIIVPRGSKKTDWEVELGVIIGRKAKYVSEKDALKYVAGYCVVNDIAEREWQTERAGQWTKGKSADSFGPIGPWLVTRDEVKDPQKLKLWLELNGQRVQNGSTDKMVYGVAFIVAYLSKFFTLMPGDIITTGTPPGVGMGMKPQRFLKAGDAMRLGIEGLGEQRQKVLQEK